MANETFSAADIRIVMAVIKNIKTIDVNWESVAFHGKFTTAKYARDSWAVFRKNKLGQDVSAKRKRNEDGDGGEQAQEMPKKTRGWKKSAKGKAGTEADGDNAADGQIKAETE